MSEEEIIKIVKSIECDFYEWNIVGNNVNSDTITFKEVNEALQGILNLYNKEKEKRKIAEENYKGLSLDLGQALKELGLYEDTIIADELVLEINKRYINKEKIKEILDKYRFCKVEKLKECYKEILELLEERN